MLPFRPSSRPLVRCASTRIEQRRIVGIGHDDVAAVEPVDGGREREGRDDVPLRAHFVVAELLGIERLVGQRERRELLAGARQVGEAVAAVERERLRPACRSGPARGDTRPSSLAKSVAGAVVGDVGRRSCRSAGRRPPRRAPRARSGPARRPPRRSPRRGCRRRWRSGGTSSGREIVGAASGALNDGDVRRRGSRRSRCSRKLSVLLPAELRADEQRVPEAGRSAPRRSGRSG